MHSRLFCTTLTAAWILALGLTQVRGEHWPQFRGPDSTGVYSAENELPELWSTTENVDWKVDLPGRGWSSPVVWGERVFLTTVINSGQSEEPKKGLYFGGNREEPPESDHQWVVLCLDLKTGDTLWEQLVHQGPPQTSIHIKNSFASETPVTDGQHVYVVFGGVGIFCFDMHGHQVWTKPLEPLKTRYGWGSAASPVLFQDHLYVVNDNEEQSYLMALDKLSGQEIWRIERDEGSNWSTPYIWQTGQRTEIVTPGTDRVRSYDLDGNELWSFTGMSSITIATPYEHAGLLMISSGYVGDRDARPLYAIRPGAMGDISLQEDQTSNAFIAWCQPLGAPYNPSTIALDGILYVLHDRGFLAAYDALSGEEVYGKQRIGAGSGFTASPWAYNGKLFCLDEDGTTFVIQAGNEFEIVRKNTLAEDDMGMATPAMSDDRLLLRTASRLYCIKQ